MFINCFMTATVFSLSSNCVSCNDVVVIVISLLGDTHIDTTSLAMTAVSWSEGLMVSNVLFIL